MRIPKIAILGLAIECNRFAPPSTRSDFESRALLRGQALIDEARRQAPGMTPEIPAFVRTMDSRIDWQPVPILWANAESGGPIEHAFFCEVIADMQRSIEKVGALDGVYICEHGAAITTEHSNPDGEVFTLVRKIVGPSVPIVATVDLHANISERMVGAVDALISYRRNPHTDMADRGADAADTLLELMAGMRTSVAHLRLPIVAPPTALLTAPGAGPYADLIEAAEAEHHAGIVNISVVGGFAYGDTPQNGLSIIVTTRNDSALARRTAQDLAAIAWRERDRFVPRLTSIEDAVQRAKDAAEQRHAPAVLLADVADNPGGGGRGNTTYLLRALLEAKARNVLFGVFTDPELAAEAHALGEGTSFEARLNRAETARFSMPLSARATVLRLHDGKGVGRRGQLEGCAFDLGQSAALMIDGVILIVITNRHQCHEPAFFEMFGLNIAAARSVVLKSRGHFRAAFDEFFKPSQIIEVDAPGLTSPILSRFDFERLPRPVIPLDEVADWTADIRTFHQSASDA
jgi:microcystin degradation protein MlrC